MAPATTSSCSTGSRANRCPTPKQWRQLSDRTRGIGFDQALVLEPPRRPGTNVFYRIFNADGGEVEQCGNGVRCVAELLRLRDAKAKDGGGKELALDSPAGVVHARFAQPGRVSVNMGVPNFAPESLPFDAEREAPLYEITVEGEKHQIAAVSMGNPHAVLTVPNVLDAPVAWLGPHLESHARFPKRVNVGFMEVKWPREIRLRVFERGVGETLACGTGACAAVAVGRRAGLLDAEVEVHPAGRSPARSLAGPGESLWLEGPAEVSFRGQVEIEETRSA